LLHLIFFIC